MRTNIFKLIFPMMILLSGCCQAEKNASVKFVKAVGPEYVKYVEADENLTDKQKERRKNTVKARRLSLGLPN